jgi:hypothetical protein
MSDPNYVLGAVGKTLPPGNMMSAARASLSPTGFDNLMQRTGGRAPTPAELVEFADAERLAGVIPPHEAHREALVDTSTADATADVIGTATA